jgi:hypothetical protein
MIRVWFWILLISNVAFFVAMQWGSHWFAAPVSNAIESELNPQKITVQRWSSAVMPVDTSNVETASAVSAVSAIPTTLACMEWAEFSATELPKAQQSLSSLQLSVPISQRNIEYSSEYWVYLLPIKKAAKLEQKLAELKAAKVEDVRLVETEGVWKGALSLGTFSSLQLAQAYADTLRKISGIKVGELRPARQTTVLVLNHLDGATLAKLTQLQKEFPQSSLNTVPCP